MLEPIERESAAQLPLYPFRINTAKLLMEVGEGEEAATVLDRLLLEDDSVQMSKCECDDLLFGCVL